MRFTWQADSRLFIVQLLCFSLLLPTSSIAYASPQPPKEPLLTRPELEAPLSVAPRPEPDASSPGFGERLKPVVESASAALGEAAESMTPWAWSGWGPLSNVYANAVQNYQAVLPHLQKITRTYQPVTRTLQNGAERLIWDVQHLGQQIHIEVWVSPTGQRIITDAWII